MSSVSPACRKKGLHWAVSRDNHIMMPRRARLRTLRNVYGFGNPTVCLTSLQSACTCVCHHIYNSNTLQVTFKATNLTHSLTLRCVSKFAIIIETMILFCVEFICSYPLDIIHTYYYNKLLHIMTQPQVPLPQSDFDPNIAV